MRGFRSVCWQIRTRFGGLGRIEAEIEQELRFHLRESIEENLASGMTQSDAEREALSRLGDPDEVRRCGAGILAGVPPPRPANLLEDLVLDLRYGVRTMLKDRWFTALALACLAVGIGVNVAMFSLVNAILLRPLQVEDADRLVSLWQTRAGSPLGWFSYPNYVDYRDRSESFSELMASGPQGRQLHLSGGGSTTLISGGLVSGNYFSGLGVEPVAGRGFLPEEDRTPGTDPVVVISYGLWERHFGSDPQLVGTRLLLNGQPFTLVGIAPAGFVGTAAMAALDAWVPLMMQAQADPGWARRSGDPLAQRSQAFVQLTGRLKPGVSVEQAQAEMSTLAVQLEQAHETANRGLGVLLVPQIGFHPVLLERYQGYSTFLLSLAGLVLLIVCANVTSMLLAKADTRRQEISIRLAVGCRRSRLIRQLLTESALLSGMGGVLGLILAYWMTGALVRLLPVAPESIDVGLEARVLGVALAVSLLTTMIFGLVPALRASDPGQLPLAKEIAELGRRSTSRTQNLLVVGQLAVSLVLLIGASLFFRSLGNAGAIEPGFDTDNVLLASVDLGLQGYDEDRGKSFSRQMLERINGIPGVESASTAMFNPGEALYSVSAVVEGQKPPPDREGVGVTFNLVGLDYLQTLGIALVEGRSFNEQDEQSDAGVVVVNETMARQFWPDQSPIGKRLVVVPHRFFANSFDRRVATVIGVAKDTVESILQQEVRPSLYLPRYWSTDIAVQTLLHFQVRTAVDPTSVAPAVRREVAALDAGLPVQGVMTLAESINASLWRQRMFASFTGILAALAASLAAVGVYGVMAHAVSRRTHEIGVRMALGAQARDVIRLTIKRGLLTVSIGLVIGAGAALALSRVIASQLFGVSASDPLSFVGGALLLAAVALLASYIPARRATTVSPVVALRSQ